MALKLVNFKRSPSRETTLEKWVSLYSTELFNYAVIRLRNRQDAEDMVQTTFLKAFRAFDSFREGSDERSWLYSILLNSIRDFSRKAARSPEVIELDNLDESYLSDNSDNPENNLLLVEREERLAKGISSLPEHFAQPLILSDIQEMSYKEIARVLQIPIGTVMSRLSRARASLMKLVQAD